MPVLRDPLTSISAAETGFSLRLAFWQTSCICAAILVTADYLLGGSR